jgi:hypothetical protein
MPVFLVGRRRKRRPGKRLKVNKNLPGLARQRCRDK